MAQGAHGFFTGPAGTTMPVNTGSVNSLLAVLGKAVVVGPLSNHRDTIDALARAIPGVPISFYKTPLDPSGSIGNINALIKILDGD